MKKLFIALLLITINYSLFAQLKPYQPDIVLDKFVGTWVAQTGKKTITINIKKIQEPVADTKVDMLVGYLVHADNNEIIEESDTPVLNLGVNNSINGEIFQDKVFFNYFDKKKQKRGALTLTLAKGDNNEFAAKLTENGDARVIIPSTSYKKFEKGFTLPVSLVFKRKK